MYPPITTYFLVDAGAGVLLLPLLLASYPCVVAAHRLPPPPPPSVLLLGGDADGSTTPEGKGLAVGAARRLGYRTPVWRPPSPRPEGSQGMYMPTPPPPPSIDE
ncbi:hypothetical protein ZWY2020_023257 [Hordeum vulgare]|nr:hypothetical protein ZWY2020_023257 [Hordeum vulgare]